MPTISLITAVLAGQHHFLGDTYRALADQDMPPGWDWEWIIQEDGTTGIPFEALPKDARIRTGTGRRGRAPMARTMALARANGVLMRTLDADDMLTPGALYRDITALDRHRDLAWVVSSHLDYLPDGTTQPTPLPGLPEGRWNAGSIPAETAKHGAIPVHGTVITAYTELIHTLGGWLAIPSVEDAELLLAATTVADGWMIPDPSLLYRLWDGASTKKAGYFHPLEHEIRGAAIDKRIDALTRTGWRYHPHDLYASRPPSRFGAGAYTSGGVRLMASYRSGGA